MRTGNLACLVAGLIFATGANASEAVQMDAIAAKLKSGDFSVVKTELTELANAGDDRAQFNLAVSYSYGNGVEKNPAEAFKWYEKAALQGNTRAEFNLASSYFDGQGTERNRQQAIRWYEAAAQDGDVAANVALGNIYSRGATDVAPDMEKAFKHYSAAAQKGSEEAGFNLGGMYLFGAGVAKDAPKAIEIYNGLAANGSERAAMILGEIYESDKYVKQDLVRSYAWYREQYEANKNPEAKSRADFVKAYLNQQQFAEAEKLKSGLGISQNQFSKAHY